MDDPRTFMPEADDGPPVGAGRMYPDGRVELREGMVEIRRARTEGKPYRVRLLRSDHPGYPADTIVDYDADGKIQTPPTSR